MSGRLVSSKGQIILLRACDLLLARGYSFRVHLVGAGLSSSCYRNSQSRTRSQLFLREQGPIPKFG